MNKNQNPVREESAARLEAKAANVSVVRQLLAVLVVAFEKNDHAQQSDTSTSSESPSGGFMRLLAKMPREDLELAVCELASSFVMALNATREQVALIALTDFGMTPKAVEQLNLPTMLGSLMGKMLPPVDAASVCSTCAFRPGSAANQSQITVSDIWHCAENAEPFMCHHQVKEGAEPTHKCRGFLQARFDLEGAAA